MGTGGEYFGARMDLRGIGGLSPGSTAQVPIQFLRPEFVLPWLGVGAEFSLREIGTTGFGQVIGSGKVLKFYESWGPHTADDGHGIGSLS
jgi:hypothetical protein